MSKITFLPFNVAEPVRPALGRQLAHFLHETIKNQPETETHYLTAMAQIGEGDQREAAFVNFSDKLNEKEFLKQLIGQTGAEYIVDGLLVDKEPGYVITLRVYNGKDEEEPKPFERGFRVEDIFDTVKWMIANVVQSTNTKTAPDFVDSMQFGTNHPEAFRDFLVGFDAVAYLQQAGDQAAKAFDIGIAFDSLIASVEADKDFLGPYEAALQLARLSAQYNVGNFALVEEKVKKIIDIQPDDWRGHFVLGELYMAANRMNDANSKLEKAVFLMEQDYRQAQKEIEQGKAIELPHLEPSVYARLGMSQMALGMAVNAERTLRKAADLDDEQNVARDLLSSLLAQLGREHEIPTLWKTVIDKNPKNGEAWAKYAISLSQNGKHVEAGEAFEEGLKTTDGALIVKRYYAPYLVGKEEYNRAMDLYEDCIEAAPKDVPLLVEYAQTLDRAGRQHEIPDVLNAVLAAEPDQNTKAQTLAWLYELEQPKRTEVLQRAQEKIDKEDFAGAVADLEPLVQWMQDYWKPWLLLAQLYNRLARWSDAERAAVQLINLFPGCEPAYGELGQALSRQERHEDAYRMLSFALRSMPGSLAIAINLALAAKRAGHKDEARRLAKQIREAVGDENIEVSRALAEAEAP